MTHPEFVELSLLPDDFPVPLGQLPLEVPDLCLIAGVLGGLLLELDLQVCQECLEHLHVIAVGHLGHVLRLLMVIFLGRVRALERRKEDQCFD